jgi:hypothetical protein
MSEHTLILSEPTYQALLEVAHKQGLTPVGFYLNLSMPSLKPHLTLTNDF